MTKNKWLIAIICVLLSLSVVALLLFFFLPKKEKPFQLTLTCENVVVGINESSPIVVRVNMPTATITYEIENTNIAQLENNQVRGISAGTTFLYVTATYKEQTVSYTATIRVEENLLVFVIIPKQNCESYGTTLYYTSPASFTYKLYDKSGNQIPDPAPIITTTEGISYTNDIGQITVSAQKDGYITFNFFEQGATVTVKLVLKQEILN